MSGSLRDRREAVVREHMESENDHEFDRTIDTFAHPRYELVPTGDVYDGEEEVRAYFAESRTAFPDQRNELIALHHADDAVIVEFDLLGTHRGRAPLAPADRPRVPLPDDRRLRVRGRPDRVRARLLRPGDDPAPARRRARPDVARRPPLHARQPPADDRARAAASRTFEHERAVLERAAGQGPGARRVGDGARGRDARALAADVVRDAQRVREGEQRVERRRAARRRRRASAG